MRWKKLGLIPATPGTFSWAASHAATPVPHVLNDDVIRVFVTAMDPQGRGRPGYIDVAATDPLKILSVSQSPLLELGAPGSFDDNGVMAVSVVSPAPDELFLYYVGFELCVQVPYRMFTGLAVSRDGGNTFARLQRTPVLDRSDEESCFRCGPCVRVEDGRFRLWYVAGSDWTMVDGKPVPVYDLRYQESADGIHWQPRGRLSMSLDNPDEHGFGRPWVVRRGAEDYRLYYSVRSRSLAAYRLGYAESKDGVEWVRKDAELGLDVSADGFDSRAIMYSAVIKVGGRTLCFYNGNDYGRDGVGVAELIG